MKGKPLSNHHFIHFIPGCNFWSINPYKLCEFKCTYCITGVQGDPTLIAPPENLMIMLDNAIQHSKPRENFVIGALSDAYPSAEVDLKATRKVLTFLNSHNKDYTVISKSTRFARDIDLFKANSGSNVCFSFSTLDERCSSILEPGAESPSKRIELLWEMFDLGISVSVSVAPWIPRITNLSAILNAIPDHIPIQLERLKIVRASRKFKCLDIELCQEEIDALYCEERKKNFPRKNIRWAFDERFCTKENPMPLIMAQQQKRIEAGVKTVNFRNTAESSA
ncbi:MAG: radical SAM protein [Pseudomonadota bacterium]